jgi:uncharacterized oxidoreductase
VNASAGIDLQPSGTAPIRRRGGGVGPAGRTVLLTGATRGIGAALARQLLEAGATVLAVARDRAALDALAARHPGRVFPFAADLAEPAATAAIATWVGREYPGCSLLINNAAVMEHIRYTAAPGDPAAIDREVAINLAAPIRLSAAMLGVLDTRRRAAICNVTSGLAIAPIGNAATYCATKAGLRSFTRALRYQCEDAGLDILVSEAVMSLVDTTLSHGDPKGKMRPEAAAAELLAGIGRGEPEIWIGKTRLLRRVNRLSPALAARIMRARTPDRG